MLPTQVNNPPNIVLTTLNAKYIHASLGLRYVLANMRDLRPHTVLREFTIARDAGEIVDELLATLDGSAGGNLNQGEQGVQIIGLGVYIWNVLQTTSVIRQLRAVRPGIRIILGGPEVSHETEGQEIVGLADHVITGWGDLSFAKLCRILLQDVERLPKVIIGEQPSMDQIVLPYAEYSDDDLAHRLLYVEASRGCPFKCEFCLSALDKTAWAFDLERFFVEMQVLYERGARHFKFIDRTFNLRIDSAVRILQFFLDRLKSQSDATGLFVHFEVVPDHLPDHLKDIIVQFPSGVLQFEIGIQSFNVEVQKRISRHQNNAKTEANMRWLIKYSKVHLHADLVFGLPGETLESFAQGFDRLYAMKPHEIQLGLLKRLRGAPIDRHTLSNGMVYDACPPYTVQQTNAVDLGTVVRFTRFARYWDKIANSGRFRQTLSLWMADASMMKSPFTSFLDFSDWFWKQTGSTTNLSPESVTDALFEYLIESGVPRQRVQNALLNDYLVSGACGSPLSLKGLLPKRKIKIRNLRQLVQRQQNHLAEQQAN